MLVLNEAIHIRDNIFTRDNTFARPTAAAVSGDNNQRSRYTKKKLSVFNVNF